MNGGAAGDTAVATSPSSTSGRRPSRPNGVPLLLALVGAVLVVLHGLDLAAGGWLGFDLVLVAVGFALARPEARPPWTWTLRLLVLVGASTLALVVLALATGAADGSALMRGDLLAAGLQFANLRAAGLGGDLVGWNAHPTAGLAPFTLAVQLTVVVTIVGRLVVRPADRLAVARVVVLAGLGFGVWAAIDSWSPAAVVSGPWFQVVGVVLGYAAGRRSRRPPTALRSPGAGLALTGVAVVVALTVPTHSATAAVVASVVMLALATTVVATQRRPLPGTLGRLPWLAWVVPVAIVAGPALATFGSIDGSPPARTLTAVGVLVASAAPAFGLHRGAIAVPAHDAVRVVAPPTTMALLVGSLALAGFFHAPPPTLVDAARNADPGGILALARGLDAINAPAAFCRSDDVARLADRLGALQLAFVDEDRSRDQLAATDDVDWDALIAAAPDPVLGLDIEAAGPRGGELLETIATLGPLVDAGRVEQLSEAITSQPEVVSFFRLTFYMERRCRVRVSDGAG